MRVRLGGDILGSENNKSQRWVSPHISNAIVRYKFREIEEIQTQINGKERMER